MRGMSRDKLKQKLKERVEYADALDRELNRYFGKYIDAKTDKELDRAEKMLREFKEQREHVMSKIEEIMDLLRVGVLEIKVIED